MGVLLSPLGTMGECDTGDTVGYFIYVGQTGGPITVTQMRAIVTTVGVGTPACEMGIYTASIAPTVSAAPTLTRIAAAAITGDITNDDVVTAALTAAVVPASSHMWLAFRCSMTGGGADQPKMAGVGTDHGLGLIATKTLANALTHSSNATVVITEYPDPAALTPVAVNMGAAY